MGSLLRPLGCGAFTDSSHPLVVHYPHPARPFDLRLRVATSAAQWLPSQQRRRLKSAGCVRSLISRLRLRLRPALPLHLIAAASSSAMPSGGSQPLASSTPPTPDVVKAISFALLGCSSPPFTFAPSSPSSPPLLTKAASAAPSPLVLACPRSCRSLCFLQLSFPASVRRLVVRNLHSAFLAVHCTSSLRLLQRTWRRSRELGDIGDAQVAQLLRSFVQLVPCQQLCPLDVWGSAEVLGAPSPLLSKVRVFSLPHSTSPIFAAAQSSTVVGVCLEMRGAEDNWRPDTQLGLQWIELFGVQLTAQEGEGGEEEADGGGGDGS